MQQPGLSSAHWRKSSLSGEGPSCVEVAFVDHDVAVRDTKDRDGGTLIFRRTEWAAFIGDVKNGHFDGIV
ncbi:DUF397 domain-containing protein [Streptosporangium sp. NBC_01469]|uniref:DUF397 domain-containing protein n=1 Tax=Streptosporangium sp. NBC_01469 TaxID=2903898 RepID=UPI002E2E4631|nr:DUF397 domain-containing protein [Streptosporangium sp. NBC_01469]